MTAPRNHQVAPVVVTCRQLCDFKILGNATLIRENRLLPDNTVNLLLVKFE